MQTKSIRLAFPTIKWVLAIVLVVIFILSVDIRTIGTVLSSVPSATYAAMNLVMIAAVVISALKWKMLLRNHSFVQICFVSLESYFYSVMLPSSVAGDVARVYLFRSTETSISEVTASVILDRLLGLFALVSGFLLIVIVETSVALSRLTVPTFILWIIVLVILQALRNGSGASCLLRAARVTGQRPDSAIIQRIVSVLVEAQHSWGSTRQIVANLVLSVVYQLFFALLYLLSARAVGVNFSMIDAFLVSMVVQISVLLPLSLAGIGVKDVAHVSIMLSLGVEFQKATAAAVVLYPVTLSFAILGWLSAQIRRWRIASIDS